MKPVLKGISTVGIVLVASVLGRQASVGLTNDLAMLQMQNVDYIPNLSGTYGLINTATWLVAGLNLMFDTTRFTLEVIPLTCAMLAVIGSYFKARQTNNNNK